MVGFGRGWWFGKELERGSRWARGAFADRRRERGSRASEGETPGLFSIRVGFSVSPVVLINVSSDSDFFFSVSGGTIERKELSFFVKVRLSTRRIFT